MYTTTTTCPTTSRPSETNRCSPSAVGSSRVTAFGSKSTASASENRTPCFRKFAAAFRGSQITATYVYYAYRVAMSTDAAMDGLTAAAHPRPRSVSFGGRRVQPLVRLRPLPASGRGRLPRWRAAVTTTNRTTPRARCGSPPWRPAPACRPERDRMLGPRGATRLDAQRAPQSDHCRGYSNTTSPRSAAAR